MGTQCSLTIKNNSPYPMSLEVSPDSYCMDTPFITPNPFIGSTHPIGPQGKLDVALFRRDGHNCNGKDGVFLARPIYHIDGSDFPGPFQSFGLTGGGGLFKAGEEPTYGSDLSPPDTSSPGYVWAISDAPHNTLTEEELVTAIKTYGPTIRFHPDEKYKFCSVDWLLEHATLHHKNGTSVPHPNQSQLPTGGIDDEQYWLEIDSAGKAGNLKSAVCYVHTHWPADHTHTDIQFWYLYAYNGPGTAIVKGKIFGKVAHEDKKVDLSPLGEHYGDWECVVLRIDNSTKKLIGVWLSQHSSGQFFDKEGVAQLERVKDKQNIVVYASLNGHANYAAEDLNESNHISVPPGGIPAGVTFSLRNDTKKGGDSFDSSTKYQLVSVEEATVPVTAPNWLNYQYRWGPASEEKHLRLQTIERILHAALGILEWPIMVMPQIPGRLALLILPLFVKTDLNGVHGPKQHPGTWNGVYDTDAS